MKKNLVTAVLMTIVTTVLLGLVYPLLMTAVSQVLFPSQANGSLIVRNGRMVGSRLIGQPFTGPGYFHSRPSAAGSGYDAANSGGTNLGPTNASLLNRVTVEAKRLADENPSQPVPIDLVTTSASGLDPDISPAAAEFQIPRVARTRGMTEAQVRAVLAQNIHDRQARVLGEPRVNVLQLNLALDGMSANHEAH